MIIQLFIKNAVLRMFDSELFAWNSVSFKNSFTTQIKEEEEANETETVEKFMI